MSAKTKIIVLRKKELALAGMLILLAVGLFLLLITLFHSKENETSTSVDTAKYIPGVYTSTVILNDTAMEVEVVVDENNINAISLANLDETVETMYPLVKPAMEDLSSQIISSQSADAVTYAETNQYTSMVLHNAIKSALAKSQPEE